MFDGNSSRFWMDPESFEGVDLRVRKFLFLFACTNSCANPLIYGVFSAKQGSGASGVAGVFASREKDITSEQGRRGWVTALSFTINWLSLTRCPLRWVKGVTAKMSLTLRTRPEHPNLTNVMGSAPYPCVHWVLPVTVLRSFYYTSATKWPIDANVCSSMQRHNFFTTIKPWNVGLMKQNPPRLVPILNKTESSCTLFATFSTMCRFASCGRPLFASSIILHTWP